MKIGAITFTVLLSVIEVFGKCEFTLLSIIIRLYS